MQRLFAVLVLLFLALLAKPVFLGTPAYADAPPEVFVSILPQKYLLERIAGDRVRVHVMVGPGQSPATYEPSMRQSVALARSRLFFTVGVPFERVWLPKIQQNHPSLIIVPSHEGIPRRFVEGHDHGHGDAGQGLTDPHLWLSPPLALRMAEKMRDALVASDPASKEYFHKNFQGLARDMEELDRNMRKLLAPHQGKVFMVYHPSWGYFADRYGLRQLPIELEGKEPSARELAMVIEQAKKEGVSAIFVQKQFSSRTAESLARQLRIPVVRVDPLADNYLANLRAVARDLAFALQ